MLVEADDITGLDRLVHQQHEAADEVAGDVADAEAEAEHDGAGEHRERGEVDAGGVDAEQHAEADQQEVGGLADADAGGGREGFHGHHPPLDGAREQRHGEHERRHDDQALEQVPEAEHRLAGQQVDLAEHALQPVEAAQHLEAEREPDEQCHAGLMVREPAAVAEQQAYRIDPEPHRAERGDEPQREHQHDIGHPERLRGLARRADQQHGDDIGRDDRTGLHEPPLPSGRDAAVRGAHPFGGATHQAAADIGDGHRHQDHEHLVESGGRQQLADQFPDRDVVRFHRGVLRR